MSEPVKDFRYYAEQAEKQLEYSAEDGPEGREYRQQCIARADVFARLAASAPVVKRPANEF